MYSCLAKNIFSKPACICSTANTPKVTAVYGSWPLESNFDVELAKSSRDSPGIRLLVFVIEGLNLLCLLGPTQSRWVSKLEELWRKLNKPFWINRRHFTHVFLGRHHQLVVNHPTGNQTAISNEIYSK